MHAAIDVAKYIITKCNEDKCPISNIQLQKILYFVQKAFLHRYGISNPAFEDAIEAWMYGPVVPSVYRVYCGCGSVPIVVKYENVAKFEDDEKKLIDAIIEEYRKIPVWDLVEKSHNREGAWYKIYNDGRGSFREITKELILEDFT